MSFIVRDTFYFTVIFTRRFTSLLTLRKNPSKLLILSVLKCYLQEWAMLVVFWNYQGNKIQIAVTNIHFKGFHVLV